MHITSAKHPVSPQRWHIHVPSAGTPPMSPQCPSLPPGTLCAPWRAFPSRPRSPHPIPLRDGGGTGPRALGQAGGLQTAATSHDQHHGAMSGTTTPKQPHRRLPAEQRGRNASTGAGVSEPGRGGAAQCGCHGGSPGAAPRRLPAWTRRRRCGSGSRGGGCCARGWRRFPAGPSGAAGGGGGRRRRGDGGGGRGPGGVPSVLLGSPRPL